MQIEMKMQLLYLIAAASFLISPTWAFSQAGLGEGLLLLSLTPMILSSDGDEAEKSREIKSFEAGLGGSFIDLGVSLDLGIYVANQTLITAHYANFHPAYSTISGAKGERFETGIRQYFLGKFYLEAGAFAGKYRLLGYDYTQLPTSYPGEYRRIRSDLYLSGGVVGRAGMNWLWKFVYLGLETVAFRSLFSKNEGGENMDALSETKAEEYRSESHNMYNKRIELYMTIGTSL